MSVTTRKGRKRKAQLDDFTPHHVLILRDRLQDILGRDLGAWLEADDFAAGQRTAAELGTDAGRNVGYWWVSTGGEDKRLGHLRTSNPDVQRALAEIVTPYWAVRAGHEFGWHPLPMFPYRMLWRMLEEFGIVDPDAYIKTGAHKLAREHGANVVDHIRACGAGDLPFITSSFVQCVYLMRGRGYRCTRADYEHVAKIIGWENRKPLRERVREMELARMVSYQCPDCKGTLHWGGKVPCMVCKGEGEIRREDWEY